MTDFAGKIAIITGGARGLGAAFSKALAARGAAVAILDLREDEAAAVAAEIRAAGGQALSVAVNVGDRPSFESGVGAVVDRFGRVDILVNNVGIGSSPATAGKPWWDWPAEAWDSVISVNLRGSFFGAQLVAPHMMKQGWGRIVNVASATVWAPMVEATHYIASKAGIIGLSRALAAGLGKSGVTVNTLVPGLTHTEQSDSMFTDEVFAFYRSQRSVPRDAVPEDLVGTLLYLCSPASDFVTGQTFIVDGGHIFD